MVSAEPHIKMRRGHLESVSSRSLSVSGGLGRSPKRVLVGGPQRDARPAGERRSGGALEGYPKRKRGDPTWSAARDDAYEQKERLGGEPYRPSPSGDSATPKAR